MAWLKGALVAGIVFYLAIMIALWALQGALLYPAPQNRPPPPQSFSEIALTANDGVRTRAFYHPADEGMPTVIYWHGNGETLAGSLAVNRMFEAEGYGLMLPEFRGYGGNEGAPSEQGFYADGRAAMQFLREQGVAPKQTVISAFSIGTGTAAQMAVEYQPAALMLNAPFRSLTALVSEKFPWLPVTLLLRDRYESESKLAHFGPPVLMTHGERDTLIPPSHTLALSRAAPDNEYYWFADLGHNQMYHDAVLERQIEWLERKLPENTPTAS